MFDNNGRIYAALSYLREGDYVQVDDGFDCLPAWSIHQVKSNDNGLYIACEAGEHYLVGQLMVDGDSLVGMYIIPRSAALG